MTPTIVAITLISYICILLTSAYYSGRRAAHNDDFFVAGRSLKWTTATTAMITAAMTGITFISVPGSVAVDSFSYMQMVLGFTAGQLVIAFILIPLFYRLRVTSLYEYLEERFGIVSRKTGGWFFTLAKLVIASLRIYLMAITLQLLLFDHLSIPFALCVAMIIFVIYRATRWGGVRSLVWIDIIKTISLVGSLVLIIIFISRALGWSGSQMVENIRESEYSRILFFDDPSSPRYFWKMFLAGLFSLIAMTGLDQDMMQCNLSCRDSREAQRTVVTTALVQIVVIFMFLCLGVLLFEYASHYSIPLPQQSDKLLSLVASHQGVPLIVGILFILGLVASTFASAASSLTGLTTTSTLDLLDGAKRGLSEEALTRLRLRVHSVLAVVMAIFVLIVGAVSKDSLINVLFKFVGYAYGPILGLFAFGILTPWRIKDRWVWVVALSSLILSIVGERAAGIWFDYHIGFEILLYNASFTFVGLMLLIDRRRRV